MSKKSQDRSFLKTVSEKTIGLVVTTVLSVGLIGGTGYLLFGAKNELHELAQVTAEFERQGEEFQLGQRMVEVIGSGWFSTPSSAKQMVSIMIELQSHLAEDHLDDSFAEDALDWCFESLAQLSRERGRISGYSFSNETIQLSQSAAVDVYDSYVDLTQEMFELVTHWGNETAAQREVRYARIQLKWVSVSESVSALDSVKAQVKSDIEALMRENERQFNNASDRYEMFFTRVFLSVLGMAIGLVVLVFVAWKFLTRDMNSSRPPGRVKKTKRKRYQ